MREHGSAVSRTGGRAVAPNREHFRLAKTPSRTAEPHRAEEPRAESLARLGELLAAHTPYDGSFPLRVPGASSKPASTMSGRANSLVRRSASFSQWPTASSI